MPHPSWLQVEPEQGEGDATILNTTVKQNRGRLDRRGVVAATGTDVIGIASYNVVQAAETIFFEFVAGETELSYDRTSLPLLCNTNAHTVKFEALDGKIVQFNNLTVNVIDFSKTLQMINGQPIEGDPGASSELQIIGTMNFAANDAITDQLHRIQATYSDEQGNSFVAFYEFTHLAAPARLDIDKEQIAFAQAGSDEQLQIDSNASWVIE